MDALESRESRYFIYLKYFRCNTDDGALITQGPAAFRIPYACATRAATLTFGMPEYTTTARVYLRAVFVGRWPRMQIINEVSVHGEIRARVSILPR